VRTFINEVPSPRGCCPDPASSLLRYWL